MELQRYGRGPEGFPYILSALPDGYWTPWHVADAAVAAARRTAEHWKAEHLAGNSRIGELHDEAERLRDLLHRMLEAQTTQISVVWKDAIRRAMFAAVPDSKSPNGRAKAPVEGAERP